MSASVVRLMVGLPVGALFPLGVPGLRENPRVHVGAGVDMQKLIVRTVREGLAGIENLAGIPGTRPRLGPAASRRRSWSISE